MPLRTIFSANDGVNGNELWITDGTAAGTVLLKDINPGTTTNATTGVVTINGSNPNSFRLVNGKVTFVATTAENGAELWVTDGTAAGTQLLKNIASDATTVTGSSPQNFFAFGGKLLFTAADATNGRELWVTDGTVAGTVLLKDINPGAAASAPSNFVLYNGKVVFFATDAAGQQLWQTDGTTAGTTRITNITGLAGGSLTPAGTKLVFQGESGGSGDRELWVTDGTNAGTMLLKDFSTSFSTSPSSFASINGKAVFTATPVLGNPAEFWVTDGTVAGTVRLSSAQNYQSITLGTKLIYNGGLELWSTDGTTATLLKDINPSGTSNPQNFFAVDGKVYFSASDGTNGAELWVTDGTNTGTMLVKDINPGGTNSGLPGVGAQLGSKFLFAAAEAGSGRELWISDGTAAGTTLVKDINTTTATNGNPNGSAPANLFTFDAVVPQPPVVTLSSGSAAFVEGANVASTPVVVDAGLTLTDPDSSTLASATVSITNGLQAGQDVLALSTTTGIGNIAATYANGVLTLTSAGATATVAQWQTALRSVTYTNSSDTPNTATRTISIVVNDGTTASVAAVRSLTVTAVNDAPVFAASGAAASYTENATAVAIATGVSLSDVDNANFNGGTLNVTITANKVSGDGLSLPTSGNVVVDSTSGAVTVAGVTIGTVTTIGDGTATVTFNANATPARVVSLTEAIGFVSLSDNPTAAVRTVTFTLTDAAGGGAATASFTRTVAVTPVDDVRVATADAVSTLETTAVSGNLLTNDPDPDGGPASTIGAVNGVAGNVGSQITLSSGALLTVNADGSYSYNPNGKFDYLVSSATATSTGAANRSATDSFTYTVAGGVTATVTVTINGVDSVGDRLNGTVGSDTIGGTPNPDLFMLNGGGSDMASGGAGDDGFFMGAAWDAGDVLDGGAGTQDQVGLQGNYAGLTLGANSLTGIEALVFLSGNDTRFGATGNLPYSYNITTVDVNVAANQQLVIQANTLRAVDTLTFNGAAELDGSFLFYGGQSTDRLTGSQKDDGFFFGTGRFGATDTIDGQGGAMDQLGLQGDYAGGNAITFGAGQLTAIEMIVVLSGADTRFNNGGSSFSYTLIMNNGNAVAGSQMTVQANTLRAGEVLTLDASGERDASYRVFGGAGADVITGGDMDDQLGGGAGADRITGRGGADELRGGAGNDVFVYLATTDSTTAARDHILDFAIGDQIDLSAIDANTVSSGQQAFTFVPGAAFSGAGSLRAVNTAGNDWLVEGDTNGDGTADFSILVTTSDGHALTAADFNFIV